MNETGEIYPELKKIESDIEAIKLLLLKTKKAPKKIVKLHGLFKGEITEEEIEEAKKSVFKFSE